ncbi:MAG: hypothetical protein V9G19_17535 [Tetrasphaera sp.]
MCFRSPTRPARRALLALAVVLVAAGCSADHTPEAGDPVFAGLDSAVVNEVLASPAAQQRVEGDDEGAAKARYQGMVRNFIACRSALSVYQTWVATGEAPAFPDQPRPTNPSATAKQLDQDIQQLRDHASSGDISLLRDDLTTESGCGHWIPAKPADPSGPTIADVVNGRS